MIAVGVAENIFLLLALAVYLLAVIAALIIVRRKP